MKTTNKKLLRLKRLLVCKYGPIDGMSRYRRYSGSQSLRMFIFKYGLVDGQIKYNNYIVKQKGKGTLLWYTQKYGLVDGQIKYKEKNAKLSVSVAALKLNGYNDTEIADIRTRQSKNSALTLENAIKKYGKIDGEKKYQEWVANRMCVRCVDHWVIKRGLTRTQALEKVRKIQSFGEDYFIKKYGEENGKLKFQNINEKRAYANTRTYYIEKFGEIAGGKAYDELIRKRSAGVNYESLAIKYGSIKADEILKKRTSRFINGVYARSDSEIQKDFATRLYEALPVEFKQNFYGVPINYCKFIFFKKNEFNIKCCVPDIIIDKLIVEFDGDYWHNLPQIIERDIAKSVLLNKLGYAIIKVKEFEYKNNKSGVIDNTINLIKKHYENKKN